MKSIFTIIKITGFLLTFVAVISVALASYGIDNIFFPIMGQSIMGDICILATTYTKIGRLYFSNWFRLMIFFLIAVMLLEQIDIFYPMRVEQMYNMTLAFVGLSFLSALIAIIYKNGQREG